MGHKSAFIAIVGSPNVGKSTLINHIVGAKVAIVSQKPQTTRNKIVGVVTGEGYQMVFLDTPGMHEPKNMLGEYMVKTAMESARDVEVVLFMVDAKYGLGERDKGILEKLNKGTAPVVGAVNKIDLVEPAVSKALVSELKEQGLTHVYPISAKSGEGIVVLMAALKDYLVDGPKYYPDDEYTDQPERAITAEMIREKALNRLREEVPHGVGVTVEKVSHREDKDIVEISATIICEKNSHKGMIIGKGGKMLRHIGMDARVDLEMLFGCQVFLKLFVKVADNWRDSRRVMKELGYQ
jgi:GTP-binding protein Era